MKKTKKQELQTQEQLNRIIKECTFKIREIKNSCTIILKNYKCMVTNGATKEACTKTLAYINAIENNYILMAKLIKVRGNLKMWEDAKAFHEGGCIDIQPYLPLLLDALYFIRDQPLCWPRNGAVIEGWQWDGDEIPRQVINAQLAVLIEINDGDDPFNPTPVSGQVTEETVSGAVTVKYAGGSAGAQKVSKTRESMAQINLLLRRSGLVAVRA